MSILKYPPFWGIFYTSEPECPKRCILKYPPFWGIFYTGLFDKSFLFQFLFHGGHRGGDNAHFGQYLHGGINVF